MKCTATRTLLTGFALVARFIWLAENIATPARAWLYPAQGHGWQPVPLGKLGVRRRRLIIAT